MYRLTTSLPYFLNRAGVRMAELFSRELAHDSLTIPMYRALAALSERGNQRLTDLSQATGVEITSMSRVTATMERRHLLTRTRPGDNMRTVQMSLTEQGRVLAGRLMPRAAHYEAVAVRGLDAAEILLLKRMLAQVYENLDELDIA